MITLYDYDVIYVLDIIPDVSLDLYISAHQIIQVTFMVIRCAYGLKRLRTVPLLPN